MKRITIFFALIIITTAGFPQNDCGIQIESPPSGYPSFYSKYVEANGIPITGSSNVSDNAFCIAYDIVYNMTINLPPVVLHNIIANGGKLAIMDENEVTTDIPEHKDLYQQFPGSDWNKFRGLGGTLNIPTTTCAEENLLCFDNDIYKGENITVHEFTHGIHNLGLAASYPNFNNELETLLNNALNEGLWENTYAGSNYFEYLAEGVQSWFNCNREAIPTNGIHNHVNTRDELKNYDIGLYNLIEKYFNTDWEPTCIASEVSVVSTSKILDNQKINIYPNPFTESFSIQSDNLSGDEEIRIFTLEGKEIIRKNLNYQSEEIKLVGYPDGFYIASVTGKNKNIQHYKLIKN